MQWDGAILDHVVINVGNQIDAAADIYRRLGFRLTDRGHHTLGTSNHLAIFEGNYLELLGFEGQTTGVATGLVAGEVGLRGVALKSRDSDTLQRDLLDRGLPAEAVQAFSRPVQVAEGMFDAKFKVVRLRPDAVAGAQVFFCEHVTPDLIWRREWQTHPNGALAVAGLVMAAADPPRAADPFRRLAGATVCRADSAGVSIELGSVRLDILRPDAVRGRFGDAVRIPDGDRLIGLTITTSSLAATKQALRAGDIRPAVIDATRILVAPSDTFGVALDFVT